MAKVLVADDEHGRDIRIRELVENGPEIQTTAFMVILPHHGRSAV